MHKSFWLARWGESKIGFHLSEVHPILKASEAFRTLAIAKPGARVLVPLCGKTLDLVWLAEQGLEVVGVEFVEQAIGDFFSALDVIPEKLSIGGKPAFKAQGITLVAADFFEFAGEEVGAFDAIYDRAALVAVHPEQRGQYARQLAKLAKPGTQLMLISFLHDVGNGPPHCIAEEEVLRLLSGSFALQKRFERSILTENSPFRAKGATFLIEQMWMGSATA